MANSYLIKSGTVVSIDNSIGVQPNCDILVENGTITAVGKDLTAPPGIPIIDASDCIVSPGFVDTHRHTWQSQLKNITSDMLLPDYFLYIRSVYGSCYTAQDVYLGQLIGALESIDAGVTFLVDHSHIMNSPEHSDAAVRGLKDAHIRGVFCYGFFANQDWRGVAPGTVTAPTTPDWRFADAKRVREEHFSPENGPGDLLRFGMAPAEIERYSPARAIEEIEYGRSLGAALITGHISLGRLDRGVHFVRRLEERNLLGSDLLFSHCGSLEDDEMQLLKKAGASISVTPETELQMAMGPCLSFKAEQQGCQHSLGIDVACNNPIDMFQQMRLLLQSQRGTDNVNSQDVPTSVSHKCEEVLRFATLGGAECVGMKDMIGSISPGKRADLVITRTTSPRLTPVHDPVVALVLYANVSDIDTVLINGRIVKKGGKFTDFDWPTLRKQVLESSNTIMERSKVAPMEEIKAHILAEATYWKKLRETA
ncbi:Metallo-dependent hydrolase [Thozetella sp. PMI_491]|nr:Metallo-dependent hydrolase [Thozetella sp. PMI_491]